MHIRPRAGVAEWQTRQTQNLLPVREWGFKSLHPHQQNQGLEGMFALSIAWTIAARCQVIPNLSLFASRGGLNPGPGPFRLPPPSAAAKSMARLRSAGHRHMSFTESCPKGADMAGLRELYSDPHNPRRAGNEARRGRCGAC